MEVGCNSWVKSYFLAVDGDTSVIGVLLSVSGSSSSRQDSLNQKVTYSSMTSSELIMSTKIWFLNQATFWWARYIEVWLQNFFLKARIQWNFPGSPAQRTEFIFLNLFPVSHELSLFQHYLLSMLASNLKSPTPSIPCQTLFFAYAISSSTFHIAPSWHLKTPSVPSVLWSLFHRIYSLDLMQLKRNLTPGPLPITF